MTKPSDGWHETLPTDNRRSGPSDRMFGFSFAAIFSGLALWMLWQGEAGIGASSLVVAIALLSVALSRPALLAPLNRLWSRIGALLQAVVSPLVMAILFYGIITPIGVLLRLLGQDPLQRRIEPTLPSYWIARRPAKPQTRMKDQF